MGFPVAQQERIHLQRRSCRRHRKCSFDPWIRKIPSRRNGNPLQYFCWENPMDWGAWQATIQWVAKLDTIDRLSTAHQICRKLIKFSSPIDATWNSHLGMTRVPSHMSARLFSRERACPKKGRGNQEVQILHSRSLFYLGCDKSWKALLQRQRKRDKIKHWWRKGIFTMHLWVPGRVIS